MTKPRNPDQSNLFVTSAELILDTEFKPGEDGNPSTEELRQALRNELEHLSVPDFIINITKKEE